MDLYTIYLSPVNHINYIGLKVAAVSVVTSKV